MVEAVPLIEALRRDDIEAAAPLAEAVVARFPEHRLAASLMGSVRHHQGRHAGGDRLVAPALWPRRHIARQIAFLKNNIAFAEVVLGDPENYAEADAFSAAALAAHPELAPFVGTRGAVLVRLGRAGRGVAAAPARGGGAHARPQPGLQPRVTGQRAGDVGPHGGGPPRAGRGPADESGVRAARGRRGGPARGPRCARRAAGRDGSAAGNRMGEVGRARALEAGRARPGLRLHARAARRGVARGRDAHSRRGRHAQSGAGGSAGVRHLQPLACRHRAFDRHGDDVLAAAAGLARARPGGACARASARARPRRSRCVLAWILGVLAVLPTRGGPARYGDRISLQGHRPHRHRPAPRSRSACIRFVPAVRRGPTGRLGDGAAAQPPALDAALRDRPAGRSRCSSLSGAQARRRCRAPFRQHPVRRRPGRLGRAAAGDGAAHGALPGGTRCSSARCSPQGGARSSRGSSTRRLAKKPRFGIRVRDFEGHVVELDGAAAAFVDDQRMLIVRAGPEAEHGIELSEVHPFSSPTPRWSRRIPSSTRVHRSGAGRTTDRAHGIGRARRGRPSSSAPVSAATRLCRSRRSRLAIRTPTGASDSSSLRTERPAAWSRANARAHARKRAAAVRRSSRMTSATRRADDLEIWALGPAGETLLAAHLPDPNCLAPRIGHPVFWCTVGWGENRALLKVDGAAGRVSRVADALPKWGSAAMLAPSKLAVVSYGQCGVADRLGVVDLETRHGTWLTLPRRAIPRAAPPRRARPARAPSRSKAGWRRSSARARGRTRR